MPPLLPTLARWLHAVALSLWLGGLVAIGALVAPTTFSVLRGSSVLTMPQATSLAGSIVGGSLHLFNFVCYACGVFLLLSNVLLLPCTNCRWAIACLLTTSLLLASAIYLGLVLTPAMNAARHVGDLPYFDRLHHHYEQISTLLQFPLLLLLALFAAQRDSPRRNV